MRFAGTRVLLVEDNPVNALLATTLLRREGCVVETAGSGDEAVEALTRARYDLVLMDMRMPGMDGLAAARAIRARGDRTPIVALTANAFVEDRKACLEAGMDDHLTKPIEHGGPARRACPLDEPAKSAPRSPAESGRLGASLQRDADMAEDAAERRLTSLGVRQDAEANAGSW